MILYVHFGPCTETTHRQLLGLLGEITPVAQPLPPDAALADVSGSVRYFQRDPAQLAALIRMRAAAGFDADCTIGIAPNPLLAQMAATRTPPGTIRIIPDTPHAITGFLAGLPATALPGTGPATVRTLASYGLTTLDTITTTPLPTLQRILGTTAARQLHQRAAGIDPTRVVPGALPRFLAAEHHFGHDELDPGQHRRALSHLAERLGTQLRTEHQVCRTLTLTVRYATHATTTRNRTLPEPTAHSPHLRSTAHTLHAALGLQRARVRSLTLRADGLFNADSATRQLTFDTGEDKAHRIEAAADRARTRYGPNAVRPASTAGLT
ncbi:DNA-directed DNA polymerase [Actinobacteria bacterium OK074]|nr:DNA-directed DNA polymerase [Actinobacteria bacterium OK074]